MDINLLLKMMGKQKIKSGRDSEEQGEINDVAYNRKRMLTVICKTDYFSLLR
tara:strand:+ start:12197 stop:12352 length:156 start_codon:yes stop_codon:yes gene_type:complete